MAADETMVRTAAEGVASLRFYGWSTATVSLGYFQSHAVYRTDRRLAHLPWVRRPSGGATLVHHHELTYALSLPSGALRRTNESWMLRMHRIIVTALAQRGLAGKIKIVEDTPIKHDHILCFQNFTIGDVLCGGRKVVGSAQRKHHQALMQHGSIVLAQSEHTPGLPGIHELANIVLTTDDLRDGIAQAFAEHTEWTVEPGDWTGAELGAIDLLARERYASAQWNERR